ncbi:MAG: NHL repeat-containing protein [candidate division Zixibacteria bacterium]|nr:NHL repeat-containing protein [candidate division Zixibacteria bacterium]
MKNIVFIFLILLNFSSCTRSYKPIEEIANVKKPLMLIVKHEISGMYFNQKINRPFSMAIDNNGYIYIVDAGNNRLLKLDSLYRQIAEIGGQGHQAGLLDLPQFISIDNNLNLIVSEEGNRRLSRFDSKLNFIGKIDFFDFDDELEYGFPSGITTSEYGEIWAADKEKNRLVIYDSFGVFKQTVGDFGYSGGQLYSPEEIIRYKSNYFVCDGGNKRIIVYDEYGDYLYNFKQSSMQYPIGAAINDNILWVVDVATNSIFSYSLRGNLMKKFDSDIVGSEVPLKEPTDIFVGKYGKVFICDSGNDRILVCEILTE